MAPRCSRTKILLSVDRLLRATVSQAIRRGLLSRRNHGERAKRAINNRQLTIERSFPARSRTRCRIKSSRDATVFLVSRVPGTVSRCGKNGGASRRRNAHPLRRSADPGDSFNFQERLYSVNTHTDTRADIRARCSYARQRFRRQLLPGVFAYDFAKQRDRAMNFER